MPDPARARKVMVVGLELPDRAPGRPLEAANYRTWQLLEPLLRDGHEVCLVAGRIGADYAKLPPPAINGRLTYVPLQFSRPFWPRRLQRIHDAFAPDCIVGVTFQGASRACRLRSEAPRWFDIYGDPTAEMQVAAYRRQSDRGIATQLGFLRCVVRCGDAFSVCSDAQRHALIGELATVGRLNAETFGYELVHVIPPGAESPSRSLDGLPAQFDWRGSSGRVALWCGGYNGWTDVDTLYRGLEFAMERDPALHFVSVGGELPGGQTFDRFRGLVTRSQHALRYHLLGWQPVAEVPGYYRAADLGISLDSGCYEAELGTRTRLVEMLQHGLPIVTTLVCELSYAIRDHGLGLTFPVGDWEEMGRQILALALDDATRERISQAARSYAATSLSLSATAAPLRDWVANPRLAPDHRAGWPARMHSVEFEARARVRHELWRLAGLER